MPQFAPMNWLLLAGCFWATLLLLMIILWWKKPTCYAIRPPAKTPPLNNWKF